MANISDYLNRSYPVTPTDRIGIAGFTALVRIEEKTDYSAESPMTPVEDGSFVGDHIIINPIRLSIQGQVSDVYLEQSPILEDLKRTQANVGAVTAYLPDWTAAQVQQINAIINDIADGIRAADALIDTGQQVGRFFGNLDKGSKSNQELFIDAMEALFYGKQVFAVDTEFRRYPGMTIKNLTVRRDNQKNATDFTLELIEFRQSETIFNQLQSAPSPASGTGGQLDSLSSEGTQSGDPADKSLLFTLIGR